MYHRVRRKMKVEVILLITYITLISSKAVDIKKINETNDLDNDIIDFDDAYSIQYDKKYEVVPWQSSYKRDSYKYKVDREESNQDNEKIKATTSNIVTSTSQEQIATEKTTELSVIPIELLSTTENILISIAESTVEPDLTVIPLASTEKIPIDIIFNETVTLPASTETSEDFNSSTVFYEMTTRSFMNETTMDSTNYEFMNNVTDSTQTVELTTVVTEFKNVTEDSTEIITVLTNKDINNTSKVIKRNHDSSEAESEVPVFTELDTEELTEVPEDYYDLKDVVPTSAPKTDALSIIFGLAGSVVESVVESVAERVVPKGLYDLFKRMQKQNEALEAEKLRSREENGGIGQFTRGVIKTISSGLSKPLSQLMAGVRDIGSLDSDRGFVTNLASGVASSVTSVANVANSMLDVFKDRVQAIYPGTVWCGDGRSARSGELGLFFFTDTCCRQHDACKLYILAGETKFGLTNTGLFTRSHCSCDDKFRSCLSRTNSLVSAQIGLTYFNVLGPQCFRRAHPIVKCVRRTRSHCSCDDKFRSCLSRTNSLVSAQIGLTYFNVLGPQCFRRAHPIVKCVRRTRITGLKCEEYELDYTKPKMWQWFDNETF